MTAIIGNCDNPCFKYLLFPFFLFPYFADDEAFEELAERFTSHGMKFILPPHTRFEGMPGEQKTMFLKDPSGNNLEFKSMKIPENLFARYDVKSS